MEFNQETNDQKNEQRSTEGEAATQFNLKQWIQDNLRIIISILIVVLIAGGIYSYSKRTAGPTNSQEPIVASDENSAADQTTQKSDQTASETDNSASSASKAAPEKTAPVATTTTASQETDNSFVETAVKGDGMTKLARAALANYLEKNPDSALTAEHKIYIEDYLRKHVPAERIHVGTSVEFSKTLINDAITKSKTLNDKQLQNLHKYAVRVPSLS